MRIVKEATERKNEILDAAAVLFMKKGFDNTSTNDILDAVGIARGTLYHHFKSKEEVMDALIDRQMEKILSAARQAAADLSVPVEERIIRTITALHIGEEGSPMTEHLHKPQNALMQQKINQITMRRFLLYWQASWRTAFGRGCLKRPTLLCVWNWRSSI